MIQTTKPLLEAVVTEPPLEELLIGVAPVALLAASTVAFVNPLTSQNHAFLSEKSAAPLNVTVIVVAPLVEDARYQISVRRVSPEVESAPVTCVKLLVPSDTLLTARVASLAVPTISKFPAPVALTVTVIVEPLAPTE